MMRSTTRAGKIEIHERYEAAHVAPTTLGHYAIDTKQDAIT